jgi:hypothetical protein
MKICLSDEVGGNTPGSVQVEVAGHDNGCARFVVISILEAILKLGTAQIVNAAALKVQVVSYQRSAGNGYIAHQSHASAKPLLKQWNFRKEPARAPEARLPAKSKYAAL